MTVAQLETERLVLEPLEPAHAAVLYPLLSDARLYEFLDEDPPESVAVLEKRYRRWSGGRSPDQSEEWLNWAARLRGTDDYVGWFQATVRRDAAQIAYLVFSPQQRRGYAREACEAVIDRLVRAHGVTRLEAVIDPRNAASIALVRTLGFAQAETGRRDLRFVRSAGDHQRAPTAG